MRRTDERHAQVEEEELLELLLTIERDVADFLRRRLQVHEKHSRDDVDAVAQAVDALLFERFPSGLRVEEGVDQAFVCLDGH